MNINDKNKISEALKIYSWWNKNKCEYIGDLVIEKNDGRMVLIDFLDFVSKNPCNEINIYSSFKILIKNKKLKNEISKNLGGTEFVFFKLLYYCIVEAIYIIEMNDVENMNKNLCQQLNKWLDGLSKYK